MDTQKQALTVLLGSPKDRLKLAQRSHDSGILKDLYVHTAKVFVPTKEEQESFEIFAALNSNSKLPSDCLSETLRSYLAYFKQTNFKLTQNVILQALTNPNIASSQVLEKFYEKVMDLASPRKKSDYESQSFEYKILACIIKNDKVDEKFVAKITSKYSSHIGVFQANSLMYQILSKTKSQKFLSKYYSQQFLEERYNDGSPLFGMLINPKTQGHVLHMIVESALNDGFNLKAQEIQGVINNEEVGVRTLELIANRYVAYSKEISQRISELTEEEV